MNKLKEKVKQILQQTGDDPCWMDWGRIYKELAELCDMKDYQPRILPREVMLSNCKRFIDSLTKGTQYNKNQLASDLLNEITKAFTILVVKLDWDLYIDPADQELRLVISEAIDKILRRYDE